MKKAEALPPVTTPPCGIAAYAENLRRYGSGTDAAVAKAGEALAATMPDGLHISILNASSDDSAVSVGSLLGAKIVVSCSISGAGSLRHITATDVESGGIISQDSQPL
jgi:hypothetical protein